MTVLERDIQGVVKSLKNAGIHFTDKTVLITGGAGFLGSWLCDVLIRQGAQRIICLDNFSSGRRHNITHLEASRNFTLVQHDISQPITLQDKIDLILHLASRASPLEFKKFPIQIIKANTLGTWVALGIAKQHNATFIYTSTSEVYGNPSPQYIPTRETFWGNVNPLGERACYDESKRVGEALVKAYELQHGVDFRILRLFNTYGPRLRAGDLYGRVVSRFIDQALTGKALTVFGDGTQTRSFTYVTDVVEGILKAAFLPQARGEVINLGSGTEVSIIDLANLIVELTNTESPIEFYPLPPDDPKRRCPDIRKAKVILEWQPTTSLQEGLQHTIAWYNRTR